MDKYMLNQLHMAGVSYNAAEEGGGSGVPERVATMSHLPAHPNKEKFTPLGYEKMLSEGGSSENLGQGRRKGGEKGENRNKCGDGEGPYGVCSE